MAQIPIPGTTTLPPRNVAAREAYQYLYRTQRWKRLRARQLRKHPYCQCPHHEGQHVPAQVVDHIVPHKGNLRLFFDRKNLQSLTNTCHVVHKQSSERGGKGFDVGCDEQGFPLNQDAAWYEG